MKTEMCETALRFRQVHPSWVQDGEVTSQLFLPTPKDSNQLSVALSEITSAEISFQTHVELKGCKSDGVMGVTQEEVKSQALEVVAQPLESPVPDPAHAYIDFGAVGSKGQIKRISKTLKHLAEIRGWLWRRPQT